MCQNCICKYLSINVLVWSSLFWLIKIKLSNTWFSNINACFNACNGYNFVSKLLILGNSTVPPLFWWYSDNSCACFNSSSDWLEKYLSLTNDTEEKLIDDIIAKIKNYPNELMKQSNPLNYLKNWIILILSVILLIIF